MKNNITMHKIINPCIDDISNEAGFELDNHQVIWLFDGIWKDARLQRYVPIQDVNDNLVGFIQAGFTSVCGTEVLVVTE